MKISNEILIYVIDLLSNNMFFIWLSSPLFVGFIPAVIAKLKGRSFIGWYIYGVILSTIILVINCWVIYSALFLDYSNINDLSVLNTTIIIVIAMIIIVPIHSFSIEPLREHTAKLWLHPLVICVFALCIFLATLPWMLIYCNARTYPPKPFFELPFAVHMAGGKAETEFRIAERRSYTFNLNFFCKGGDPDDRKRVEELVGGESNHPLRFDIGEDIKNQEWTREWSKSAGCTVNVVKNIGRHPSSDQDIPEIWLISHTNYTTAQVWLQPGRYRLSAESLQHIKQLAGEYEQKPGKLGISTPLRLTITALDGSGEHPMLIMENLELQGRNSSDDFVRHIAWVLLQPGRYRVRIESLKDVPELLETPVKFEIR